MIRKALSPVTAATVIVIMYMIMPILSVFVSRYITTYSYMLLVVFLLGFIMLFGGLRRLSAMIYLLVPFIVYVICTLFINTGSTVLWGYQSMMFLLPVILGYYFTYYREESAPLYAKIIIAAVIITVITTIIGLIQFPSASRILATVAESDDPERITYGWHNIGGYSFVYMAVLLYPILILAYKVKKISRITFLVLFVALLVMVILSEYTTALLLVIITSVLYFAGRRLNTQQLFILGMIIFLVMFFFWGIFEKVLLWLADSLGSETLSERLTALAGGIRGLENSESNRIDIYRMSLNAFAQSPVFGNLFGKYTIVGGHSFVLDLLANYGILGGAAMVSMYRNIYRYFIKPFSENIGYGYVLWAFVQAIVLSVINTGMWLEVLAFFIPVLLTLIYNTNSEEDYENSLGS